MLTDAIQAINLILQKMVGGGGGGGGGGGVGGGGGDFMPIKIPLYLEEIVS